MTKNARNKMKKENPPNLTFNHVAKKDILGHTDAAQQQRRSTDAVMITADVLTVHFRINRRCTDTASEL